MKRFTSSNSACDLEDLSKTISNKDIRFSAIVGAAKIISIINK